MDQIEILDPQQTEAKIYQTFLQEKFSKFKDNQNPIDCHILIKSNSTLIAGATLVHQKLLEHDRDVDEHWEVEKLENCTRILRLWASRSTALPKLLRAIEMKIPKNNFVYGLISVSPRFARENSSLFKTELKIAKPRIEIQEVNLLNEDYSASDGQRLIQVYKQFDADFLGPLAANKSDKSVRALMGIPMALKREPQFLKRNEKVF